MNALQIGLLSLATMLGGGLIGQRLARLLPPRHHDAATREAITLAASLIITITSLTLSLMLYSTKTNFDTTEHNTRTFAASIILLDRSLRAYGTEAEPARALLRDYTERALHSTWPEEFGGVQNKMPIEDRELGEMLFNLHNMIRRLHPSDPYTQEVAAECRSNMATLIDRRFSLIEGVRKSISPLLMTGVIAWLMVIFVSFGLNAPRNPLVVVALGVCAVAAASCITLMNEMDASFSGIIKVSSAPMLDAFANVGSR